MGDCKHTVSHKILRNMKKQQHVNLARTIQMSTGFKQVVSAGKLDSTL